MLTIVYNVHQFLEIYKINVIALKATLKIKIKFVRVKKYDLLFKF